MDEAVNPGELLSQIEAMHDTLIGELALLDARICSVLKEYAPPRQTPAPISGEGIPCEGGGTPLPTREAA